MTENNQMLRNSRVMASMTAVSRVFGLAREVLIASLLGTTRFADVWNMAFMVPNLFRRFLAEGAMTSALVPTLSEVRAQESPRDEAAFARAFFTLILVAATVVTAAMILLMPSVLPLLIRIMTPVSGAEATNPAIAVAPTQLMFPYLLFVSLAAVCQGILNVHNRFALPAATPIFLNISVISIGYLLRDHLGTPIWGLCAGVLVGGVLQFGLQWMSLARMGLRLKPTRRIWTPRTREAVRLWIPITAAAGIYQINTLISQTISFNLFDGAMAALNYSNRLMELVLGIFATAMSTSILPLLSVQKLASDRSKMRRGLWRGIESLSAVTMPASIGLIVSGYTLIALLFQRGQFSSRSLDMVYGALLIHGMALIPISWYRVLSQTFFAFKHVKLSLVLTATAAIVNVALCFLLPGLFDPLYAHLGIATATLCYAWGLVFAASTILKRSYELAPARGFAVQILKITLASAAFVPLWLPLRLEVMSLGWWLGRVFGSVVIYVGMGHLLAIRSHREITEKLVQLLGRARG